MRKNSWSSKEEDFLRNNSNLSYVEISKLLDRGLHGVRSRAQRLGISRKEKSPKIGQIFGKLTVINRSDKKDRWGTVFYFCKCDCGGFITIDSKGLLHNKYPSCGCSLSERAQLRVRSEEGSVSWKILYGRYERGAKERGLEFKLLFDKFIDICSENCFYCNIVPIEWNSYKNTNIVNENTKKRQTIRCNGIDRVNNKVGYRVDNCVPCCSHCNWIKGRLTLSTWLSSIERFQPGFTKKILKKLKKTRIKIPKE